jgi:hypothetical protein
MKYVMTFKGEIIYIYKTSDAYSVNWNFGDIIDFQSI